MPRTRRGSKEETTALYVRLPKAEAEKLDRAAFTLRARKRDLVAGLVARYVDPATRQGLDELRTLGTYQAEVPLPPPPERETPQMPSREPTLAISRASDWVAAMHTEIREFAKSRRCATPLVRVTLGDGDQFFLHTIRTGPGDEYVNLGTHPLQDGMPRALIVRLDVISKIELLREPPSEEEREFVFKPRSSSTGFTRGD